MISTKILIPDIKSVPVTWVFEHYCKLDQKLTGQDIKIKSVFNPSERTPSMCIYFKQEKNRYQYKDFSTDNGGDCIDLVQKMLGIDTRLNTMHKLVRDYNEFVLHNNGGYDLQVFKQYNKYKIDRYEVRQWNTLDKSYWGKYGIGSRMLEHYNIKPLSSYTMFKEEDGIYKVLNIEGSNIYGYFKKDSTLVKIYQPKVQKKKFLKVKDYIQGSEQLSGNNSLVIVSSLKDGMCLKKMYPNIDFLAPDSENTMIKKEYLDSISGNYKNCVILFDNDAAGNIATIKYCSQFNYLKSLYLPFSKDISDSVKDHGYQKIKEYLENNYDNIYYFW
jgi:hypothetical protein